MRSHAVDDDGKRQKRCRRGLSSTEECATDLLAASRHRARSSRDRAGERVDGRAVRATVGFRFGPGVVEESSGDRIMLAVHGVSFLSVGTARRGGRPVERGAAPRENVDGPSRRCLLRPRGWLGCSIAQRTVWV